MITSLDVLNRYITSSPAYTMLITRLHPTPAPDRNNRVMMPNDQSLSYKKYSLRPGRDGGTWRWSSLTALNSLNVGRRSSPTSHTDARFPHR